jgi:hypothetical protein
LEAERHNEYGGRGGGHKLNNTKEFERKY